MNKNNHKKEVLLIYRKDGYTRNGNLRIIFSLQAPVSDTNTYNDVHINGYPYDNKKRGRVATCGKEALINNIKQSYNITGIIEL